MGITQDKRRRELELEMRRLFYVYRHVPTALFASRLLLHPLSVVKTHLQIQRNRTTLSLTTAAFRGIYRQEGIRGFYRGFVLSCGSTLLGPVYAVVLDATKICYSQLHNQSELLRCYPSFSLNVISPTIAGAVASVVWQAMVVPVDIVTQIQMVQHRRPISPTLKNRLKVIDIADAPFRKILQHLYKSEGIFGFYRGFAASLAMYIPASAIVWTSFENLRNAQKALLKEHPSNPMIWAVCGHHTVAAASAGFLSGVCSGILTNPIDVVKTRVQLISNPKEATVSHTVKQMLKTEGLAGFTNGIWARTMSHGPKVAIITLIYELVQRSKKRYSES